MFVHAFATWLLPVVSSCKWMFKITGNLLTGSCIETLRRSCDARGERMKSGGWLLQLQTTAGLIHLSQFHDHMFQMNSGSKGLLVDY